MDGTNQVDVTEKTLTHTKRPSLDGRQIKLRDRHSDVIVVDQRFRNERVDDDSR